MIFCVENIWPCLDELVFGGQLPVNLGEAAHLLQEEGVRLRNVGCQLIHALLAGCCVIACVSLYIGLTEFYFMMLFSSVYVSLDGGVTESNWKLRHIEVSMSISFMIIFATVNFSRF